MNHLRAYRENLKRGGDMGVMRHSVCRGARYFFCICTLVIALAARAEHSAPYIPSNANVVLQLVPPTTDPRVRRFEQLREDFQQHPKDIAKAVDLARAYIDYGRSTGDARYLGRAMAIIEPIMAQPTPPISVMLVHATILQSRHDFTASRKELDQIFQRDPGNAQAWLTLATVAMVQGDDDVANNACVQLANASSDFMGMICTASLRSLTGHAKQAYALMSMVEDPGPKAPPEIRAWIEGLMADTAARMGNPTAADAHFSNALRWAPSDNFLLADYGEFLIDQGRAQDAINLVAHDTQSDTSFLVLVSAESASGSPRTAGDAAEMDARFQSMDQRGDHVFLREESSYLLRVRHEPKEALDLAKQDWMVQRSPKDVRVYLEAAIANHDVTSAKPVLAFISRTHLTDVTIDPLVMQLQAQASARPSVAMSQSP
jgi:thioredoxin-like negative regulator of GroEL